MSIAPYISNIKQVPARKGDQFFAKAEWLGTISSRHDSVYNFTKTRGQVKTFVIRNRVYNPKICNQLRFFVIHTLFSYCYNALVNIINRRVRVPKT